MGVVTQTYSTLATGNLPTQGLVTMPSDGNCLESPPFGPEFSGITPSWGISGSELLTLACWIAVVTPVTYPLPPSGQVWCSAALLFPPDTHYRPHPQARCATPPDTHYRPHPPGQVCYPPTHITDPTPRPDLCATLPHTTDPPPGQVCYPPPHTHTLQTPLPPRPGGC